MASKLKFGVRLAWLPAWHLIIAKQKRCTRCALRCVGLFAANQFSREWNTPPSAASAHPFSTQAPAGPSSSPFRLVKLVLDMWKSHWHYSACCFPAARRSRKSFPERTSVSAVKRQSCSRNARYCLLRKCPCIPYISFGLILILVSLFLF